MDRYILDKVNMAIYDTENKVWVCLVDTKRPDIFEQKVNELLSLANRPAETELLEALKKAHVAIIDQQEGLTIDYQAISEIIMSAIDKYKGSE